MSMLVVDRSRRKMSWKARTSGSERGRLENQMGDVDQDGEVED